MIRSTLVALLLAAAGVPAVAQTSPLGGPAQSRMLTTNDRLILGSPGDLTASVVFADVDGDGDLDILYANGRHWAQINEVYLNNGVGQFTVGYPLGPEKATSYAVPAGDLDGDGDVDVVVGNDRAENWVYLNDGVGHFTLAWSVGPEVEPTRSVQLHDLDGDGDLDVLVTNRGTVNGFYLNDGRGRFGPKRPFGDPDGSTIAVAVGDVDADGDVDLVLANRDGQANQILLNDGALGFRESGTFGTGHDETRAVALADLNGDGFLDIVAVNIGEPNAVYLGAGDGTFAEGAPFGAAEESYAVATSDVDLDGDLDVVVANVGERSALYLNDGTGKGWTGAWLGEERVDAYGVAVGDLTGDRYPEVGLAVSGGVNRIFLNAPAQPARGQERAPYDPEARLAALGITLPQAPSPVANYLNGVRTGNLIFLAGKGPRRADGTEIQGKLGVDVSIEEGYEAARLTALNQLAVLKAMLGNLDRVVRIVKVLGMVNSAPDFVEQPAVINGFSDLMVEVFGDRGRHARAAVGMASLPRGQAVEIELVVEVR